MRFAGENSPLTVRDVIERHDGEMWLEREKVKHRAFSAFGAAVGHAAEE